MFLVTKNSSSHQRASIKKITPKDLKLLATTNFNLNELYKVKQLSKNVSHLEEHTYNNLNFMEGISKTYTTIEKTPEVNRISQIGKIGEQMMSTDLNKVASQTEYLIDNDAFLEIEESAER